MQSTATPQGQVTQVQGHGLICAGGTGGLRDLHLIGGFEEPYGSQVMMLLGVPCEEK